MAFDGRPTLTRILSAPDNQMTTFGQSEDLLQLASSVIRSPRSAAVRAGLRV
jgi:hypothetical protein